MGESEREATASSKRKVSDSLLQGRMRRASKSMSGLSNTMRAAVFLLVLSGLPKSTSSIRMDALHNACPGSSKFAGPVPLRRFALRGGEGEEMSQQENGQPTNEGDGGKSPVRSRSGFTTPPTESRSPHPELLGSPRTQAKIARDVLSRDKKAIDELLQSLRKGIEESQTDSPEFASSMASASYAVVSPAVSQATPVDSSSLHTALEHERVRVRRKAEAVAEKVRAVEEALERAGSLHPGALGSSGPGSPRGENKDGMGMDRQHPSLFKAFLRNRMHASGLPLPGSSPEALIPVRVPHQHLHHHHHHHHHHKPKAMKLAVPRIDLWAVRSMHRCGAGVRAFASWLWGKPFAMGEAMDSKGPLPPGEGGEVVVGQVGNEAKGGVPGYCAGVFARGAAAWEGLDLRQIWAQARSMWREKRMAAMLVFGEYKRQIWAQARSMWREKRMAAMLVFGEYKRAALCMWAENRRAAMGSSVALAFLLGGIARRALRGALNIKDATGGKVDRRMEFGSGGEPLPDNVSPVQVNLGDGGGGGEEDSLLSILWSIATQVS